MQANRSNEIDMVDSLVLPLFIKTLVVYSLSVVCLIVSMVIVSCILKTESRKCKNCAHIAWISAFTMLVVGSASACFFTLVSMFTKDHCDILDYTEQN